MWWLMIGDTTQNTDDWHTKLRELLRRAREGRGISLAELKVDGFYGSTVSKIERGTRQNLFWRQAYKLCQHYKRNPLLLLGASDQFLTSVWPPDALSLEDWSDLPRQRLRKWRGEKIGTPKLAAAADVRHTWIIRIESGEVEQLDLIRLHRVFRVLDRSIVEAFEYP